MSAQADDVGGLKTLFLAPDSILDTPPTASGPEMIVAPSFAEPPKPIADFVVRPDFPKCVLGVHLDIGGFTGVVIQIINQSLKIKSPEGVVQSFNSMRLRKIYGPAVLPDLTDMNRPAEVARRVIKPATRTPVEVSETSAEVSEEAADAPVREFIEEPDFDAPTKNITEFAGRADFPKCAYGQHVDIADYAGVVVEIVKQSLKVKSFDGITRSFNIPILRKLYGQS